MKSVDRTDDHNTFIYDFNHQDTRLGGLWIAEGITDAKLRSLVGVICVFTDTFELSGNNERLVKGMGNPFNCSETLSYQDP